MAAFENRTYIVVVLRPLIFLNIFLLQLKTKLRLGNYIDQLKLTEKFQWKYKYVEHFCALMAFLLYHLCHFRLPDISWDLFTRVIALSHTSLHQNWIILCILINKWHTNIILVIKLQQVYVAWIDLLALIIWYSFCLVCFGRPFISFCLSS